jgi:hypothetical protein
MNIIAAKTRPAFTKAADGDIEELITKAAGNIEAVSKVAKETKAAVGELKEHSTELSARLQEVEQKVAGGAFAAPSADAFDPTPPSDLFLKSEGFARFKNDGAADTGSVRIPMSIKALTSLQGSPESPQVGIDVQANKWPGLYGVPIRSPGLFAALPSRPVTSNSVEFEQLQGFANAADYQDGEGTQKPVQTLVPELQRAPIATIAVLHTASKQVLADEGGLAQSINLLLRSNVLDKAERELVSGTGGDMKIDGLLPQSTLFVATAAAPADRIGECAAQMASEGYIPTVVVMNPLDMFAIQSERSEDGAAYVAAGWASPARPALYGVPVVSTAAVPVGFALVIDARYAYIADREVVSVRMTESNKDDFERNLVTIRAEMRLGLVVLDPMAVRSLSLAEESSSGS